ncbi:hypothetical protein N803_11125 [Knoellia subterranea KCTC 19937]|uniref:Uncharacterized protein n=1 Tax=Knoellia subterranea KCTC 19937 TaxID=1385521 RepID=A0A0A0JNL1_9MICO|nr:hypothetical protein N803_11125 [Knoellia subterranea KCTC 19937]
MIIPQSSDVAPISRDPRTALERRADAGAERLSVGAT